MIQLIRDLARLDQLRRCERRLQGILAVAQEQLREIDRPVGSRNSQPYDWSDLIAEIQPYEEAA